MKIHRFIGAFDLDEPHLAIEDAATVRQMRSVLKLHAGEEIIVSDGAGYEALGSIARVLPHAVEVALKKKRLNECEPNVDAVLYASVLKKENFEFTVQKAVEAGVKEIAPVIAERTVKLNMRTSRLEAIAREAAEQSGRAIAPVVRDPAPLAGALEEACASHAANFFFDARGAQFDACAWRGKRPRTAGIFVGPEGGWTEKECDEARACGCVIAGLGAFALRAETAAVIASYLVARL